MMKRTVAGLDDDACRTDETRRGCCELQLRFQRAFSGEDLRDMPRLPRSGVRQLSMLAIKSGASLPL